MDDTEQRVGCAGWTIPREAAAAFAAEGSHLERYAAVFNAAEINSSFYKPHRPQTYARWAASVPAGTHRMQRPTWSCWRAICASMLALGGRSG